jgi:site-specific DNA recombinase
MGRPGRTVDRRGPTPLAEGRYSLAQGQELLGSYSVYDQPPETGITIPVPAIVSEELFAAVQERLAENRKRNRQSRRGAKYLLQGLIVCRRCGYGFYGKPVGCRSAEGKPRRYAYYRCIGSDAYRFGGERICTNKQVRTDLLDQAVWDDVCGLLRNPKRIEAEYERRLSQKKSPDDDPQPLQARIQKVKQAVARLIDAYEEGLVEKEDFQPRIKRLRERLGKLESEARAQTEADQQQAELRLVIGRLEQFAAEVEKGLDKVDWEKKRDILRTLVKRVEVDEEQVRVVYRIGPLPFDSRPERSGLQDCWRRDHSALRRPDVGRADLAVFHHPCLEELLYQS